MVLLQPGRKRAVRRGEKRVLEGGGTCSHQLFYSGLQKLPRLAEAKKKRGSIDALLGVACAGVA